MAMIIAHNNMAINTQRNLGKANGGLAKSIEKLSSGYRINTGADGPADLVISEQLRAQQAGMSRALRNTNEADNVLGIAEGALNEMNSILKRMKQMAIHASNSGITSPDQVRADQAELNSGIETLNRIANATRYSDQQLLNGNKAINFTTSSTVSGPANNSLIDASKTKITQAASLNSTLTVTYTGTDSTATAGAIKDNIAKKAFFEADAKATGITGNLTMDIGGVVATKRYTFQDGAKLGDIAHAINVDSASTGVSAQLIFASDAAAAVPAADGGAVIWMDANWQARDTAMDDPATVFGGAALATAGVVGKDTDADGAIWVKVTDATKGNAIVYKDKDMTMEVGRLSETFATFTPSNGSTLTGLDLTGIETDAKNGDILRLQVNKEATVGISEAATAKGFKSLDANKDILALGAADYLSGVRLGENTDVNGNLYVEVVLQGDAGAGGAIVNVYKDSSRTAESLVATGKTAEDVTGADVIVNLAAINTKDGKGTSGIYGALTVAQETAGGNTVLQANNLGIRLSSTEYGDDAKVSVSQVSGTALFADEKGNMIQNGYSAVSYGQSATVNVNGKDIKVGNEFRIDFSSDDISANVIIDKGELGRTTLAVMGYSEGAMASKAGTLLETSMDTLAATGSGKGNYAAYARNTTTTTMSNLTGGAKLQLGEGTSYYERTTLGLRNMTSTQIGQVDFTYFEGTKKFTSTFSLDDVKGGGKADLFTDPDKAMAIIEQAIKDVSDTRAQIGSVQANMLQTNANNLEVAIENIQKTESAIRDTDMASEMTEFTKNQVLQSASMSMLAQANQQSQSVLQLLG